MVHSSEEY